MAIIMATMFGTSATIGAGVETNVAVTSPITYLAEATSDHEEEHAQLDLSDDWEDEGGISRGGRIAIYIIFAILLGLAVIVGSCLAICAWGTSGLLVLFPAAGLYILYHFQMVKWIRKKKRD